MEIRMVFPPMKFDGDTIDFTGSDGLVFGDGANWFSFHSGLLRRKTHVHFTTIWKRTGKDEWTAEYIDIRKE